MVNYRLLAKRENLHGILDPNISPALKVKSGDKIVVETLDPDWRVKRPSSGTFESEYFPRIDGYDDDHALTGPIYVEGALPGKALKIEIGKIVTDNWGWCSVGAGDKEHLENLGFSGELYFSLWDLDVENKKCTNELGIEVPMSPFPGVVAVAPKGNDKLTTKLPGKHGGNLDCKELGEGSVLYLPIYHEGALLSVGDGHAAQGDGESCGTAIEAPFKEIEITLSVVDLLLDSPLAYTQKGWISFGFDENLTKATYEALENMRLFLKKKFGIDEKQAMVLCSLAGDLHITQIVNGIKGVHCIFDDRVFNSLKTKYGIDS